jgi:hypothetical protein
VSLCVFRAPLQLLKREFLLLLLLAMELRSEGKEVREFNGKMHVMELLRLILLL